MIKKKYVCCFCKKKGYDYGNNAMPLNSGRCCNKCNMKVIQKRLELWTDTTSSGAGR